MRPQMAAPRSVAGSSYLFGRGPAWFAYLMTIAFVRDYKTVETKGAVSLSAAGKVGDASRDEMLRSIYGSWTVWLVCIRAAAQLIALSALWSWLPSYLNRTQQVPPEKAGLQAAVVVLAGAVGSVVMGAVADRAGLRRPGGKFIAVASLSVLTAVTLILTFGGSHWGLDLPRGSQFSLIVVGGFATCTVGPAAAIVIGVIHPGVRATGASVLSLFQNLFGLAAGPIIAGALSDVVGLEMALTLTPIGCLVAALSVLAARRAHAAEYEGDWRHVPDVTHPTAKATGRGLTIPPWCAVHSPPPRRA